MSGAFAGVTQQLAPLACLRSSCAGSCVGVVECNEAAILSQAIEPKAKDQDQKFVRTRPEPSPAPTERSARRGVCLTVGKFIE